MGRINITELIRGFDKPCNSYDGRMMDLEMRQQNLIAEFNYTKWLPAGMQGIKENKGNCRNCGANSYKNNKCNYCGTNN